MQKCPVQLRHHCPVAPIYAHKLIEAEKKSIELFGNESIHFINMLKNLGAVETVKKLISKKPSSAFLALNRINRLNLTVEGVIIENPELHPLFTEAEIKKAKNRINHY